MALLDSANLAADPTFQNRVLTALLTACVDISNEGWTVAFHRERSTFAVGVQNNPTIYKSLFAGTVATDPTCLSQATSGGTVSITTTNASGQQALVSDTNISNAISAQFNTYFRTPAS